MKVDSLSIVKVLRLVSRILVEAVVLPLNHVGLSVYED